jgi:hypothetical protein
MAPDLEDKLKALGIPTTLSDPDKRQRLRQILKKNHPDTTGGDFEDPEQKRLYQMANDAIEIIDASSAPKTELQLVSESHAALLKFVQEERQVTKAREQSNVLESAQARANSAIARSVHSTYFPFQVGSWGIAAIAGAITLLNKPLGGFIDEALADHPAWAHNAKIILGGITLLGLLLGFYARQRETRQTNRLKALMSDDGINFLLEKYSRFLFIGLDELELELELVEINPDRDFSLNFSLLADAVQEETGILDRPTCEATADAIIQKLLQRELIRPKTTKSISRVYEIDKELVRSFLSGKPMAERRAAQREALRRSRL